MAENVPSSRASTRLTDAIAKQEKELERRISGRGWDRRDIPPEMQRVLGVAHESLGELRRLHLLKQGNCPYDVQALDHSLLELLEQHDISSLSIPAAWEHTLCLQRLLLLIGDRYYIKTQLLSEWQIETTQKDYVFGRWSRFFDVELLKDLVDKYKGDDVSEDSAVHRQAVEYLTYLSVTRNSIGRSLAMNARTRTMYLDRLTALLAALLLLLLGSVYIASHNANALRFFNLLGALWDGSLRITFGHPDFKHALISAVTGGLGSTLSGFYKLRDKVSHLNDLRSFRAAMWAQPFVGAVAGVLLFLIIRSGVIGLGISVKGDLWPVFGIYGFLAGFSEPFFLGLVERVAGAADKQEEGKGGGGAPATQPPPAGEGVAQANVPSKVKKKTDSAEGRDESSSSETESTTVDKTDAAKPQPETEIIKPQKEAD